MFGVQFSVMGKTYSIEDVLGVIRREVEGSSLRAAGGKVGLSAAYLSDILHNRRDVSDEVAKKFGFRKIVTTKVWFEREAK